MCWACTVCLKKSEIAGHKRGHKVLTSGHIVYRLGGGFLYGKMVGGLSYLLGFEIPILVSFRVVFLCPTFEIYHGIF